MLLDLEIIKEVQGKSLLLKEFMQKYSQAFNKKG